MPSWFEKVIGMFRPAKSSFLDYEAEDVIKGPNDRAMFGFDTYFPLEWLVKDFGFTEEEARCFIDEVHRRHAPKTEKEVKQ